MGTRLRSSQLTGCLVIVIIVNTTVKSAENVPTVLVGDDTDLLILLLAHVSTLSEPVYFVPEPKKRQKKDPRIWDVQCLKNKLGNAVCRRLLFVLAMSGCDTTSRLFGQNKMDILKMASQEGELAYIADQFLASISRENVQRHGKRAMFMIYNGCKTECTDLDTLRHIQFEDKAASSFTHVSCSSLPPTSAATAFHALRVYYQIQVWLNLGDELNVLDWGWKMSNGKLCPIHTDLPPAPSGVLQVIRCGCKGDCASFRCSCKKHGLECSTACRECRGSSCANTGFTASDTADTA